MNEIHLRQYPNSQSGPHVERLMAQTKACKLSLQQVEKARLLAASLVEQGVFTVGHVSILLKSPDRTSNKDGQILDGHIIHASGHPAAVRKQAKLLKANQMAASINQQLVELQAVLDAHGAHTVTIHINGEPTLLTGFLKENTHGR